MIKTIKKLVGMAWGIGLVGAIAIPTTLMSSCSSKQELTVVKFYYNFTLTSIYPTSYTIFENGIPTKKVSDLTINFKSDIIRQLK